ncbi:MAG: hypothetical protein AUJ92_20685 [Armatimonadetes bacterium CG2_30_59_28]|nr:MAG: hypothetical protein AUJ92_20685 [Armatimonadetes bacterium CG2_30_59_28]PIU66905.1 MAG: hypothetical protein COS85_02780 [Armatimonadetes bacterium CG07_land_8_20_14_0_80_59_28]PIX37944.1 MAG: hypothetical protein COZ56_21880 [Armatimonadetes bacterium CG_4_8_14_3_um_filter_58_9]PIY49127.1 MAG: hypothetical protein COZ05_01220 [Armatimonadetes bacterium CG_4_10_14_3_um_filter_59_10]
MRQVEDSILQQLGAPVPIITDVFSHTISAGGKRLRPALCVLSASAIGSVNDDVVTLGAQIELIHTVTLVHDDIVDNARTRRGKPTANAKWGNETSVLVGDYMFARVFESLTKDGASPWTHLLARTTSRMSEGELQQVHFRGHPNLSEEQYLQLIQLKTAELTSAACQVGAMAAGASARQLSALGSYGLNFGMAFQITDDLLDVTSAVEIIGKPAGNDLKEGKVTLPFIHALAVADDDSRNRVCGMFTRSELSASNAAEIIAFIMAHGGIDYSRQVALNYANAAKESLADMDDSPALDSLKKLAEAVVDRQM